ncbi:riboflavin synthase subunit alpha [Pseudoalteromonas sp. PS5]|uniref:riboflavin synthase subunit alpha n=1 Tax=Pseudoalteromonas sp. PS5 TaxID=1437473 RepID=UPI000FFE9F86|nr:riboflavin synthase subunit alpha [Pseudoalteromonas sp. PS5]RXF02291.1 riboflavin synthase subunit alpha [Pseudoalteromonas sp. PS5]
MFTGIVQTKATVVSAKREENLVRLVVSVGSKYLDKLTLGASIAINGCCLTVVHFERLDNDVVGQVSFDVIDETLTLTNLGNITRGEQVNFERSMTFGTELGGHIISGHIQTSGHISVIKRSAGNVKMHIALPQAWLKYVMYKGFIAVNGASLTVGEVDKHGFWLHLIPETLALTNLGTCSENDTVNIEVDQQTYTIINTVENYMKKQSLLEHVSD